MTEGVGEEHIYKSPKNIEEARIRNPSHWFLLTDKEGKKYIRDKQLNLNCHICKSYRVVLCDEFQKGKNSLFKRVEPQKIFNYN